jgi:predicted glutamine amidotransferase
MCRLFGMTGGGQPVAATFWLLEAPDSLAEQSRREPDGTGLGVFDADGRPVVEKQPLAAYADEAFARAARERATTTFVAHVRYASTGGLTAQNTHPFCQDGRLLAHNGVIGDLDALERQLGPAHALVQGETDSERFFALITRETQLAGGDVGRGIEAAATWIAEHLPVYALNIVLTTARALWALRYPDTHDLFVLERAAGGPSGEHHLEHSSARGSIRVRSGELRDRPAVVVATERMDEDPGWRNLEAGELLHVDADLGVHRRIILSAPPNRPLALADLDPRAAASQAAAPAASPG